MKRSNILLAISLLIAGCGTAAARADRDTASPVFLEFLNAPDSTAPLLDVPQLAVGVAGKLRKAVVDTGSTGVVLSASSIPGVDRLPSLGAGTITYSSSGRIMTGRWVVTPLVIAGRSQQVTTLPIAILAVDSISCTDTARHCTPRRNPAGVAMLGIGFGREHDHQPGGTPDRNPLLNLTAFASHSYVISRFGIVLGADRRGFGLVHLKRDTTHQDWFAPAGCITVERTAPACGTVLVDTGITGMFLTVPADRLPLGSAGAASLADGTAVAISLIPADGRNPAIGYAVRVGDTADVAAPSSIILAAIGRHPPFVNTGVHLLNRYDYLYDADAGMVGYRATERP